MTSWHHRFNQNWRNRSKSSKFLDKFPYLLPLGVNQDNNSYRPYLLPIETRKEILVTESYEKMFHRLMLLRTQDFGGQRGAVITGQPGIGAYI